MICENFHDLVRRAGDWTSLLRCAVNLLEHHLGEVVGVVLHKAFLQSDVTKSGMRRSRTTHERV